MSKNPRSDPGMKKQASILSYFKPKNESKDPISSATTNGKKKKKYDTSFSNFIFISSDSDDDSDSIQVLDSKSQQKNDSIGINDACQSRAVNSDMVGDEFCDTEPFLSVTFEESDMEMITDTIKVTADDLVQTSAEDDYVWNSFRAMIDWVLGDKGNEHLFNDEDWNTVRLFTALPTACQRLYIRLFVRRRKWIRPSRMNYPDLGSDLQPIIDELVKSKFISNCDSISDLREGLELLSQPEIKSLAKSFIGVGSSVNKTDSIDSIIKLCNTSVSIKSHFSGKKDPIDVVALRRVKKVLGSSAYFVNDEMSRLFSRMTYLYYPPHVNEDENGVILSHELLNTLEIELGNVRYPSYTINKKEVIYKTRQELIDYDTACRLESRILVAIEKKDTGNVISKFLPEAQKGFDHVINNEEQQNLPTFLRNQTAGHVYTRCLHHIVTVLEQQKQHSIAVEILNKIVDQEMYCQHYKGRWLERLAINYESHLKRPSDAFSIVRKGLKDPNVHFAFRYTLYMRAKRLSKSSKVKSSAPIPTCPEYDFAKCKEVTISAPTLQKDIYGRKTIFIDSKGTGDCISVEKASMNYYLENGYAQGVHSESKIYHALLGLFFWDIIYQYVQDVFRFKNQKLPLDFVSNHFYEERKATIDERLELIRSASLPELYQMMDNVWGTQMGCLSIVAWDSCDLSQLKEVVCCMGNGPIAAICERLLKHFRYTRSGMPDLLVWDVSSRKIKAVEVKGPGDSLSSKQILWLEYFNTCSLPAEVCYVKAAK